MRITDPIADMLTRIRNGLMIKANEVSIPNSIIKKAIADILVEEGYIKGYVEVDEGIQTNLKVTLKYGIKNAKIITGLRRISRPGLRVYASVEDMPTVLNGLGIAILSTNKGIMTDKKAREAKVGGEVLAYIW